jgi:cytochrome c-type biogenesis protein CcmF
VANLRRQFTVPGAIGLVTGAVLVAAGMRDFYAVVCYTLAAFVLGTILQEFQKGVAARMRMHGEAPPRAFVRLVARNRRRYGGYVVHFGMITMFAAFAGLAFKKEMDVTLKPGESYATVDPWGHRWRFTSTGASQYKALNRYVTAISLETERDGQPMGIITSEKRQHVDSRDQPTFEPSTEVGIRASLKQDVYVVLAGVTQSETAELRIQFNPLVEWVWIGGLFMAIGGLIVMWPQAERKRSQSGYVAVLPPEHVELPRPLAAPEPVPVGANLRAT